jgi:hydroxyacylglutathione hydrolase
MDPRITRLTDELFFIERGWLNGNHLVFAGKPRTLIDTGYIRDAAETESLIAQCGLGIEQVELIVNTHAHCDHIGGNAEFQRRSGCQVALHLLERYFVDQRNDWATWWGYYGQDAAFFPTHYSLTDGEVLTLGEMNWLVLHTPGHGAGQIALYCLDTGWLVSADTLWGGDFGVLTTRVEGLDAPFRLRESLERLSRLKVQKILPGHGPILDDAPAAIQACLARVETFIAEPRRMALDQVRKILLYTVLMRGPLHREGLWNLLITSPWFPETADMYFGGKMEATFRENLDYLLERGLLKLDDEERLVCTLPA